MIYTILVIIILVIAVLWLGWQVRRLVETRHPKHLAGKIDSYSRVIERLLRSDSGRRVLSRFFVNEVSLKGFLNDLENTVISSEHPEDLERLVRAVAPDDATFTQKIRSWAHKHAPGLGDKLFEKLNITPTVTIQVKPKPEKEFEGVPTAVAAFVGLFREGPLNEAIKVNSVSEFQSLFGGPDVQSEAVHGVRNFFANGGQTAHVVRIEKSVLDQPDMGAVIGSPTDRVGLHALELADIFNILCFPDLFHANMHDNLVLKETYTEILTATLQFCEKHRAFFILDPPAGISAPQDMLTFLTQNELFRHANGALYFPRILILDPMDNTQLRNTAPSGSLAGMYARMDEAHGVWKAPAGTDVPLHNAADLAYHLTEDEINTLNPQGINCLRELANQGILCWGARTLLSSDPEWQYISVRRLALFIEESIYRGTQWAVFEPNGEVTWQRIRQAVREFLYRIFRQGAFPGSQSEEGYYVNCDNQTTRPADIQNGILNIDVGIAPVNPGEFINIRIQHQMT
jgi:hypothetical protein